MQEKTAITRSTGRWGEQLAVDYLTERGFAILARNYRTKFGEIDIIARRKGLVCFFEVKARGPGSLISPLEAITTAKAKTMKRVAEHYLMKHPRAERMPCSFGVTGIDRASTPPHIECVLDAFE